ncbi:MAG: hypothetical protein K8W52_43190 [Deltaproteobacteria bacterium]|nr:hypothetical protein [Deltaproteobacteria bacterium]
MQSLPRPPRSPLGWLAAGATLLVLANMRWGIGALAWIAPIPLLRYLRITSGWRARTVFVTVVTAAWIAATAKIVSAPLPAVFALVGAPLGLSQALAYLGANRLRRNLGAIAGVLVIPAVLVVVEYAQPHLAALGLGTWGAAGYTQVDNPAVLQLAAVFGLAGVSFLIYLTAAALEAALSAALDNTSRAASYRVAGATLALAIVVHAAGSARLAGSFGETRRFAAVGTIATFDGSTIVSEAERAHILDQLERDTEAAARAGATVVVWNEAAALTAPTAEPALQARVQALAARLHVHVVAAYIVERTQDPLVFENKYVWARPDGAIDHSYWKHHPAPGEPSIIGEGPATAIDLGGTVMSGALCYDYDFPAIAAGHGELDVDVVALPSSDWRGIDPIHTQMAAVRAIEQGVSILRSTRFGLSAGIDPVGRLRAWSSSFETPERVMIVDLPRHGTGTIYRAIGDVLVWLSIAGIAAAIVHTRRRRQS